ncbi:hypothetical protein GCM10010873_11340 [Cypionkella aquatica]|uniref:Uncharacterized protein n=1 Tax=Cypionkella aquatica TaxID=1756042 RepID=A0AA37TUM3_9RHOB|nr:hypothetical protein [Cypionkella aquatica]GLS86160.1 hypothetical protein GCM10010873_11340 [Cypionkella aquatica]
MKLRIVVPLLVLASSIVGSPALAGSFTPPEGCTATLTVQSRGCYVANYYTCEKDNPGDKWRADFDQEGMFYLSKIDRETQWIESYDLNPTVKQTLDPNPADPANFSSLLSTGRDDFEFGLTKDNGEHTNVKGFDKLTGESVTIDGVTLQRTEFDYVETDDAGNELRKARGHEYISAEYRNFFSGQSEWWDGTQWLPLEGSPVQFYLPGEKGFAATQPIFECDAVMSEATPLERLWRASDGR